MKVSKRDYFLAALEAGSYQYKRWVLEAFSITAPNPVAPEHPLPLHRDATGWYFLDSNSQRIDIADGPEGKEPLFGIYDELVLQPGDMPCVSKTYISTYGSALTNAFLLVYPFGGQFEYMDGELTPSMFDRLIERNLVDGTETTQPPNPITIEQNIKYSNATAMMCEFTQLCVPAATRKTMTVDPKVHARRAELLKKYEGRLNDPVVQALIGAELIKLDREWMRGDPGEGFYFKNKSYDVVRKKLFLFQGSESGFGVQGEMITTALDEGWDIDHLPSMINGLRDGSYNRGAQTALGGEATKFFYRIFQNTQITELDCGSTYGLPQRFDEKSKKNFLSNSIIVNGKSVLLTEENIDQYINKNVKMRSPMYCRTEGANFCATCMGRELSSNPTAISTYAAGVGSTFMLAAMSAMHGKALSVANFDISEHIS